MPVRARRQRDAADMMQTAGLAGFLLEFLVEPDRIALQCGHVGIGIERVEAAGRMPGRTGCEFRALDERHIAPAELGQVIKHRAADNAAADHRNAGVFVHVN